MRLILSLLVSATLLAGVIATASVVAAPSVRATTADDCKTCQDIYRKRIATCNTVYPPDSRSKEHTACLAKAKSEFDDCLKTCK